MFASTVMLDQSIYARIDNVIAFNISGFSLAGSSWAAYSACGTVLRLNNVAVADVSTFYAESITGGQGGAVCITDETAAGLTLANNKPIPLRTRVQDVNVTGCSLTQGGCAVYAALSYSTSLMLSLSGLAVTNASAVSGAAVYTQAVAQPVLQNISCSQVSATGNGACIALNAFSTTSVNSVQVDGTRTGLGGAALWASASATAQVSVSQLSCSRCAAQGSGGAIALVGAADVALDDISCVGTSSLTSDGGCISLQMPSLPASGGFFMLNTLSSRNTSAATRGGALSIIVSMTPADSFSARVSSAAITSATAGACSLSPVGCASDYVSQVGGGGISFLCGAANSAAAASVPGTNGFINGVALPTLVVESLSLSGGAAVGSGSGGGLLLQRTQTAACHPVITLIDSIFTSCSAGGSGGGMFAESALIEAQRVTISNCSAGVDGGGWFGHGSSLFSPNLIAAHNVAGRYGGGSAMASCLLTGLRLTDATEVDFLAPSASPTSTQTASGSATSIRTLTSTLSASYSGSRSISNTANSTAAITSSQSTTRTISSALSMTGTPSTTANATGSPTTTATPSTTATGTRTVSGTGTAQLTPTANTTRTPTLVASLSAAPSSSATLTGSGTRAPAAAVFRRQM